MRRKRIRSLQTQTILTFIILIVATWALMTFILVRQISRTAKASIEQTINLTADKKAQELNNSFVAVEKAVQSAGRYILRTLDEKRVNRDKSYVTSYMKGLTDEMTSLASFSKDVLTIYLRLNIEKYGPVTGIFLENTKSGFIDVKPTDLRQFSPTDFEHTGWYYLPVWKKEPMWTSPYNNKNINVQMISYLIPLYRDSELLGVVGMDIDISSIREQVKDLPDEYEHALLIGQEKKLLYDTNAIQQSSVEQSANITVILDNFSENDPTNIQNFTWGEELMFGVMRKLTNGMFLIVSLSKEGLKQKKQFLLLPLVLTTLIIIVLTVCLIYLALKKIITPITTIAKATYKLSRGELNISIPYTSKNELGILADNIRMMTSQMHDYISHIHEQATLERQARVSAQRENFSKSQFLASMYLSLHEIDLVSDTFTEITCRENISQNIGVLNTNAKETLGRVMRQRVRQNGQARKEFMDFIDFSTLDERMKDRITIAQEFISINNAWCRARFILMDRNDDGTLHHVLWAVEDISRERSERERLENEIAKSLAASEAKSAFLANMSHEIRTPINAVIGMNEMILRESKNKSIRGYAANIKSASTSLLSIVNDILDFSKIEAGKMELFPENYDIASMVVDLVNMITPGLEKKNLALNLQTQPTLPRMLYGDSVRLKQCILNLLTNAVKYTRQGAVTLTIGYSKIDGSRIQLHVAVEDTGSGIKKQDIERLFSPFERIDEVHNRSIEGTGLGIPIVRKFLEMMDSKLEVKSTWGKGSLFSFVVDQLVVDWTEVGDINERFHQNIEPIATYHETLHAPKAHLLFVDDTEMNLEVVRGLLKKTEIKIDTASSGQEALEKVKKNTYDILFIDHRMPEMDGIETLHAMKKLSENKSSGKPCIALTANAIAGVKQMYLNEGFNDYLAKPVNPEKLEEIIRKYLPPAYLEEWLEAVDDGEESFTWKTNEIEEADDERENQFTERFRGLSELDINQALTNCSSAALFETTIRRYFDTIEETCSQLKEFLEDEDIENYGTKVHSLKSTSRLIGLISVSEEAEHLEESADFNRIDEIKEKHPLLMAHIAEVRHQIEPLLCEEEELEAADENAASEEVSDDDSDVVPDEILHEKLQALYTAAENFDINTLDSIVKELSQMRLSESFKDIFAKIRTSVDNIAYTELKTIIKPLLEERRDL